jgi:iron complex outermembrane receptor protein
MEPDVKFSLNVLPLSIVLAASSVQVFAEDQLPALVVSASRSDKVHVPHASSIKVITREEIELSGARSLPELLRGQSGVYVSDLFGDGSNASVDMRGFGSTANANTLIMVDGRKLNFATDSGTLYFNAIDLDNVEQVEITQGSSGILFGNMAVGGVINVITRKPVEDVIEAALDVGSYNSHKERVRFENILDDGWSSRLVLVNRESDNYRDHNDAETKSASLRLDKVFNGGRVFAEYEYLDDYLETPGALFLDEIAQDRRQSISNYESDYQNLINNFVRSGFDLNLNQYNQFLIEFSYVESEREFISSSRVFGTPSVSTQSRENITLSPRIVGNYSNFTWTLGVDYESADYRLLTPYGPQENEQNILSGYVQVNTKLSQELIMIAGLRYAEVENDIYNGLHYELDDNLTIGSFGLNYNLSKNIRLYTRVEENFRFARVDEHTNVISTQPVGLKNQTGVNYEIGMDYHNQDNILGLQLFKLKLDNEIGYTSDPIYGNSANTNLDSTDRFGLNISLVHTVDENLLVGLNYSHIEAKITGGVFDGKDVPEVPGNTLNAYSEYSFNNFASVKADFLILDERFYGADFTNQFDKLDDYAIFNLSGNYQFEEFSLNFRLNNVFDEHYSESGAIGYDSSWNERPAEFTSPERNLWIGMKVNL